MRNIYKLIAVLFVVMLTACSREGSSGVQDGTRWPNEADARRMVQEATR